MRILTLVFFIAALSSCVTEYCVPTMTDDAVCIVYGTSRIIEPTTSYDQVTRDMQLLAAYHFRTGGNAEELAQALMDVLKYSMDSEGGLAEQDKPVPVYR